MEEKKTTRPESNFVYFVPALATIVVLLLLVRSYWQGQKVKPPPPPAPVQAPAPKTESFNPTIITKTDRWPTYNNKRRHYSFKYPPLLKPGAKSSPDNVYFVKTDAKDEKQKLRIFYDSNIEDLVMANWLNQKRIQTFYQVAVKPGAVKKLTILGLDWYYTTENSGTILSHPTLGKVQWIMFNKDDVYMISNNGAVDNETLKLILATFSFL